MIALLIFGAVLLLANAQEPEKIDCNFGNSDCKHAYDQRMKILQMFERVWNQCPVVTALDRNIGYLARGWDVNMVIRQHVRGDYWPVKFIYGKEDQVSPLYDVYLTRHPNKAEIAQGSQTIATLKDYKFVEDQVANSAESFSRYRNRNIVPGCGREDIDCTFILDSITQSHCRLFRECPNTLEYLGQSPLYGTGELASPMMIHRHYMHSLKYEQRHMTGKSSSQKVQTLFRHLLNRDVTPSEDTSGLITTTNLDYRQTVVQIQNSQEYQSKWGKWTIPGDDANGQDINMVNLSFQPPC